MYSIIRISSLLIIGCLISRAQVNVLTANGDNTRTNANLQETLLASATVTQSTFGKIGTLSVDGQIYAQVLYVNGLPIPGSGAKNVLFVSTMHNSVYAYNADSLSPVALWHVNLGPSVPSVRLFGGNGDINTEVGILGTGAIDLQRGVLYVVSDVYERGVPAFYLHALDLTNGEERLNGPVAITAAVPGTAGGSDIVQFDPQQHMQRPGLLIANNAVYVAFGSHGDQAPWHGWVMSYDASNLTNQLGVFLTTPSAKGGSIWQSGRGLAADDDGNIYAIAANGDYDGLQNFSQTFLKLAGAAPVRVASFTPADWKSMSDNDFDLSAGPALIPATHTFVGADKLGSLYILDTDSMALSGSVNSESGQSAFPVAQLSIFNFAVWSRTGSTYIYVQGEQEGLKCFQLNSAGFDTSPVSMASAAVQFARIGITISANGDQSDTGIVWETTGNYNVASAPGTLHAFDASNLANELWNSDMNPGRDVMGTVAKFVSPTVANGKVYVPTFSNTVVVYGLLGQGGDEVTPPVIGAVANAASYSQNSVSPGELVAIFGSNLGPSNPAGLQLDPSGLVATSLADTRVLFDGVPVPIESASASQVNAIVPFGVSARSTQVQVEYQGQLSNPFRIAVTASCPGIFAADDSGGGQGIILNQDGTMNSADNPASAGSVIVLYATGAGQLSPDGQDGAVVGADSLPQPVLPVSAMVGGQAAKVLYAGGAVGIVEGIIQVNLQIPNGALTGPSVPVVLQIGDAASQPGLTLALQ